MLQLSTLFRCAQKLYNRSKTNKPVVSLILQSNGMHMKPLSIACNLPFVASTMYIVHCSCTSTEQWRFNEITMLNRLHFHIVQNYVYHKSFQCTHFSLFFSLFSRSPPLSLSFSFAACLFHPFRTKYEMDWKISGFVHSKPDGSGYSTYLLHILGAFPTFIECTSQSFVSWLKKEGGERDKYPINYCILIISFACVCAVQTFGVQSISRNRIIIS